LKILSITSSYPRFEGDIAGHFVAEFNDILAAAGHQVKTLAWRAKDTRDREGVKFVAYLPKWGGREREFETLFFGSGSPENLSKLYNKILVFPAMAAMWREIVKQEKPDLIIGHWMIPGGILARLAGHFFEVPSLVIGHSGGLHALRKLGTRSILRSIIVEGEVTIPNPAFFDVLPRATSLPIGFLPIGEKSCSGKNGDALIMSRLEPIKNIERVIEAWSTEKATLHIAGDGSQRSHLEHLAGKTGSRVVFHGFVMGEKKKALMDSVKYFFLPSKILEGRHEGFPIGLLQAIDSGLIPLVAEFPGVGEVISDAFLVSPEESWERAFKTLRESTFDLSTTREKVRARRWENIEMRWTDFIERIS